MINQIFLTNFKCFEAQSISLAPLTLLAGLNGSGKSSVIQSLLLLRQSFHAHTIERGRLNTADDLVDLGTPDEVLYEGAKDDQIGISLWFVRPPNKVAAVNDVPAGTLETAFRFPGSSNIEAEKICSIQNLEALLGMDELGDQPALFAQSDAYSDPVLGFQYLNAERNGPRKSLPMIRSRDVLAPVGTRGEYVLDTLLATQDTHRISADDPRFVPADTERLRDQLGFWLNEVSPGAQLEITPIPLADLLVSAFTFGAPGKLRSRPYRATNVGFGLSYILPVLVALLTARKDGLVIVENPEAHLHPQGQTRMGELCALAAAAGVQVIIETHSDHLMDGARIAIREHKLASQKAAFHYFSREAGAIRVTSPAVDDSGRLSEWPAGFFDQQRRNTARLVRPGPIQK